MKWIQDISSTGFFSLIFGIGLVIISFVCAECGKKKFIWKIEKIKSENRKRRY